VKRTIAVLLSGAALVASDNPAQGALDALRALKSVTTAGVTYRDYQPRLLDARVAVDKYLATPATDETKALREAMQATLASYELAGRAWGLRFQHDYAADVRVGKEVAAEAATCPSLDQTLKSYAKLPVGRGMKPDDVMAVRARMAGQNGAIFPCGAAHFADAEKAFNQAK
jgi:hypothetical protein